MMPMMSYRPWIRLGCWLCLLSVSWAGASPVAAADEAASLDAAEIHALDLGLRAIKMSRPDLAFKKDHAESEYVLDRTRIFLHQPLGVLDYGHRLQGALGQAESLEAIGRTCAEAIEVPIRHQVTASTTMPLDRTFLEALPDDLRPIVQEIADAAALAHARMVRTIPGKGLEVFSAFVAMTLDFDRDPTEIDSWETAGLDVTHLREILRREQDLELQDGELAQTVLTAAREFDVGSVLAAFHDLCRVIDQACTRLQAIDLDKEFHASVDTPLGKIICGGSGNDVYAEEAFLLLDIAGDDIYRNSAAGANGLLGRAVSIVIDGAGNDSYISRESFSQGSGVFGIGILVDLGGDDSFSAKHFSQGAGWFGCGALVTGTGSGGFTANTFAQGAAMWGAGLLWQRGGDSSYRARELAQGYGGVGGCGLLLDNAGNDLYSAGGQSPCGWLPGQYFSMSQGFAFGIRPHAGGGVGLLVDSAGDDRYVAR